MKSFNNLEAQIKRCQSQSWKIKHNRITYSLKKKYTNKDIKWLSLRNSSQSKFNRIRKKSKRCKCSNLIELKAILDSSLFKIKSKYPILVKFWNIILYIGNNFIQLEIKLSKSINCINRSQTSSYLAQIRYTWTLVNFKTKVRMSNWIHSRSRHNPLTKTQQMKARSRTITHLSPPQMRIIMKWTIYNLRKILCNNYQAIRLSYLWFNRKMMI